MSMNKANTPGAQKATSRKRSDKNAHPRTASQQVKQPQQHLGPQEVRHLRQLSQWDGHPSRLTGRSAQIPRLIFSGMPFPSFPKAPALIVGLEFSLQLL